MSSYNLDTFISHENIGRAYRNQFEVSISTDTNRFIPLRVQSVIFDNLQLTGDYLDSIKRYTVTGVTPPKTMTLSAVEMIDFSSYQYLLQWVGKVYNRNTNTFMVGADASTSTGRRRDIVVRAEKTKPSASKYPLEIRISGIPLYIPGPSFDWKDGNPITLDSIAIGVDTYKVFVNGIEVV